MRNCSNCKHWQQYSKPHDMKGACTNKDHILSNIEVWYEDERYNLYQVDGDRIKLTTISGFGCVFIEPKFTQVKEFNEGC